MRHCIANRRWMTQGLRCCVAARPRDASARCSITNQSGSGGALPCGWTGLSSGSPVWPIFWYCCSFWVSRTYLIIPRAPRGIMRWVLGKASGWRCRLPAPPRPPAAARRRHRQHRLSYRQAGDNGLIHHPQHSPAIQRPIMKIATAAIALSPGLSRYAGLAVKADRLHPHRQV